MDLFSSSKASSSVYITASVGASVRKRAFKSHGRKEREAGAVPDRAGLATGGASPCFHST